MRVANFRFSTVIVYGGNEEPIAIDLDHNEVINQELPQIWSSTLISR